MNRLKSQARVPMAVILSLMAGAALIALGGAMHAICKNQQIALERRIDATEKRIDQTRMDIEVIGVRMDEELDRFELKDRLRMMGSSLTPVGHGDMEHVLPLAEGREVAANSQP